MDFVNKLKDKGKGGSKDGTKESGGDGQANNDNLNKGIDAAQKHAGQSAGVNKGIDFVQKKFLGKKEEKKDGPEPTPEEKEKAKQDKMLGFAKKGFGMVSKQSGGGA